MIPAYRLPANDGNKSYKSFEFKSFALLVTGVGTMKGMMMMKRMVRMMMMKRMKRIMMMMRMKT